MPVLLAVAAAAFAVGMLGGYGLRVYLDRREQAERERVLTALGGGLPHFEQVARELDAAAVEQAKAGLAMLSRSLLEQAQQVRTLGKMGQ